MKITRRAIQLAFLVLVVGGVFLFNAHIECWCPFGGIESLYTYATEGNMACSLGTTNFFALGGVLLSALLLHRFFCGFVCPVGTISDWMHSLGRWLHLPQLRTGTRINRTLGLMKYVVFALVVVATWMASELIFRGYCPFYALISRHGEDITFWTYAIAGAIVVVSAFVSLPFCRWLCPLAVVLNPFSAASLSDVKRDTKTCVDCGACSKACPMELPVAQVECVSSADCIGCQSCIQACPKAKDNTLVWSGFGQNWSVYAPVIIFFLLVVGVVSAATVFPMPSFVKSRGTPTGETKSASLEVENLTCRGRANLLYYYLDRNDGFRISGYFKIEAWPGPGFAHVRVTYEKDKTSEEALKLAITEAMYEHSGFWRQSPFAIAGYSPPEVVNFDPAVLPGLMPSPDAMPQVPTETGPTPPGGMPMPPDDLLPPLDDAFDSTLLKAIPSPPGLPEPS